MIPLEGEVSDVALRDGDRKGRAAPWDLDTSLGTFLLLKNRAQSEISGEARLGGGNTV